MKNMRMNKVKLLITSTIILLGTVCSSNVFAYNVIPETVPAGTKPPAHFELRADDIVLTNHRFYPHRLSGELFYCIESHGAYKASLEDGYIAGQQTSEGHENCGKAGVRPPWNDTKLSMEYDRVDPAIDFTNYQDAAYIFAEGHHDGEAAHAIWSSLLNEGVKEVPGNSFGQEAATYKAFYELIHSMSGNNVTNKPITNNIEKLVVDKIKELDLKIIDVANSKEFQDIVLAKIKDDYNVDGELLTGSEIRAIRAYAYKYYVDAVKGVTGGENDNSGNNNGENNTGNTNNPVGVDNFENLLEDNTDWADVKTNVKRSEIQYVIGPFNMSYPDGKWNGINKFSWVKNVRILDQDENMIGSILGGNLEIIDKNGNKIMDTVVNFDAQGKAIYGQQLNVPKNGENFYVKFKSDTVTDITVNVDFGYLEQCDVLAYRYEGIFYNWFWQYTRTSTHQYVYGYNSDGSPKYAKCQKYRYTLEKTAGEATQTLAAVLSARKIYKDATLVIPKDIPGKKIDITMDINGRVFLDQDEGKANEGNNHYDSGEELADIDVWLYRKDGQLIDVTVTDAEGKYEFKRVNAQKEYYVQFVYNGMLYTNVTYEEEGENSSKATEEAQGHGSNRTDFNNKFAEIASYPQNYSTKDCINGANITNRTFMQDDLVTIFKDVAKQVKLSKSTSGKGELDGNRTTSVNMSSVYQAVMNKYGSDSDIRAKVQYVADCRIKAYTVTNYSRHDAFIVDEKEYTVGNILYKKIYYEQKYVNLGIKARPTFDLALYKDTVKADVQINGKNETYTYDARKDKEGKGFTVGVSESDYLNGLRSAYISSQNYQNDETRALETDTYDIDLRAEEVANAQVTDYIDQGKKVDQKYNVKGTNEYTNYTNLDLQNGANKDDRLKIFVQYRISLRNQSGIIGAVTEVVDYFDTNYKFVDAYEGDSIGNKIANVNKFDTSMYGQGTEYKNDNKYTTIYLRPERENRLHNDNKEQYIYVTLQLLGPQNDAGDFLKGDLLNDGTVSVLNVAEINGYKTYSDLNGTATPGLVDIDSNPGNFDITSIDKLNDDNIKKYMDTYEDDTSRAPAMIYRLLESRSIEGTVFEDSTGKNSDKLNTGKVREGNGKLDKGEKGIKDVIVQLVEIKNGQMITRAQTRTNNDGWYGFTGFIPGDYTIRYIYGSDDKTAMTTNSWYSGSNETSYNGQDYQSTKFTTTDGGTLTDQSYKTDSNLIGRYEQNFNNKDNKNTPIETTVNPLENTTIRKYQDAFYWYTKTDTAFSDAYEDEYRRQLVINYSKNEYGTEIANYKSDVFNSYLPKDKQPSYMTDEYMRQLANELERRTYRYSYTPEITIEVEYAKRTDKGNKQNKKTDYEHAIKGVDFGIVERPKAKIELTKNVSHIKIITTDGTAIFDTNKQTTNLSWPVKKDRYENTRPIVATMDDELLNGATIEITYKFTVTNKSELGEDGNSVISAKNIIDYVDNSLTFNIEDNAGMWEVVSPNSIQNETKATLVNNHLRKDNIDLSTIQTIVKTTANNPLTKNLAVGETAEGTLKLRKVLAAESDIAELTYDNISEIVEIKQVAGRYDHTSVPGNQNPEGDNAEDDTYRAETVKILPPFGKASTTIYFIIGASALAVLGCGIFLIKKYVTK